MASINKCTILGNLGRDPDVKVFPDGGKITTISIATTDRWKDKQSGEMREATEWHRVVFHNRLAEIAAEYLRKGSQVVVEGALRTRKYEQDGVTKYTTEIFARELQMLGSRPEGSESGAGGPHQTDEDLDQDIPF